MSKIENAVKWMEDLAKDNTHGYDQIYRWGEKGDYDCSSAVITALEQAGIKVKTAGATYTGNMSKPLIQCGFKEITSSVNRSTGAGLQRGDILLNVTKHVAMYCGNGKEVEASINERGEAKYGKPGDQTGREILIRNYRNYPWTNIYRYMLEEAVTPVYSSSTTKYKITSKVNGITYTLQNIKKGATGEVVRFAQQLLIAYGYSCGASKDDGDFGTGTHNATVKYQKDHGLVADGEIGPKTWNKLLGY